MNMNEKICLPVQRRGGFSDRNGIDKMNTNIQIKDFDKRTRTVFINKLQEVLSKLYADTSLGTRSGGFSIDSLANFIFVDVYNLEMDADRRFPKAYGSILSRSEVFYKIVESTFKEDTYDKVLTVIEAIFQWTKQNVWNRPAHYTMTAKGKKNIPCIDEMQYFNKVFEQEFVGYRFVGGIITPITDEIEIKEIEAGLSVEFGGCRSHIQKALAFLSDRENPDYKNSIKESISAVESICQIIAVNNKATLGQAIKMLEDKGIKLHSALKSAFSSLYGYTSDEGGIRHAEGLFESNVTFEEAKYMLVSCCAFVNYLIAEYGKIK